MPSTAHTCTFSWSWIWIWLALSAGPPTVASAQTPAADSRGPWAMRLQIALSGNAHSSEPEGYTVYSGIGMGGAFVRDVSSRSALELSFALESREVNGPGSPEEERLGSIEMLPLNFTFLWRPSGRHHRVQPYVGGGLNVTICWEKSGAVDSSDVPISAGPVAQLGIDIPVSGRARLNVDVKWNSLTATIERFRDPAPSISIDPLTLTFGVGVSF